jgi:hypothetical protein
VTDHDELRALVQRYARAVDRRDIDALAALFDPGATIVGAAGSQTLDAWLEAMRGPRAFPTSMHLLGDPLIVVDDRTGTASLDTYAVVYQISDPASGHADLTLGIDYLDEVARVGGRWVITRREARTVWMR